MLLKKKSRDAFVNQSVNKRKYIFTLTPMRGSLLIKSIIQDVQGGT